MANLLRNKKTGNLFDPNRKTVSRNHLSKNTTNKNGTIRNNIWNGNKNIRKTYNGMKERENERPYKKIELLSDTGNESYYKLVGIESTPSIGDKEIKSDLYIRILNMKKATGDERFDDEPYYGELLLLPKTNEISNKIWKSISESNGMTIDEVKKSKYAPIDVISYGYSVRLQDESGNDPEKIINELAQNAEVHASMIGFDLDKHWNQIGNTGWDTLREITTGKPTSIDEVFKRNRQ